jgi:small-conductance mechanosensitive channel
VHRKGFFCFGCTFIFVLLSGCATGGGTRTDTTWEDATLIAEQQAVIERQREYISDLVRIIQAGAGNLREAEERLGSLEQGNIEFKDWLQRVDDFVRAVIAEQRRLEQVQFTNSGADAGA